MSLSSSEHTLFRLHIHAGNMEGVKTQLELLGGNIDLSGGIGEAVRANQPHVLDFLLTRATALDAADNLAVAIGYKNAGALATLLGHCTLKDVMDTQTLGNEFSQCVRTGNKACFELLLPLMGEAPAGHEDIGCALVMACGNQKSAHWPTPEDTVAWIEQTNGKRRSMALMAALEFRNVDMTNTLMSHLNNEELAVSVVYSLNNTGTKRMCQHVLKHNLQLRNNPIFERSERKDWIEKQYATWQRSTLLKQTTRKPRNTIKRKM